MSSLLASEVEVTGKLRQHFRQKPYSWAAGEMARLGPIAMRLFVIAIATSLGPR